jgi:hypothetical protein
MLFESNAIGSDGIEVRRLDMRVTQGRQAIASPLIRSYEEYVHGFIFTRVCSSSATDGLPAAGSLKLNYMS